ncbi:MAG: serine/threonine protein kinase [Bacteroidales bacterium]|nr:serine/threonine protein kinase [Bacteroidales bacterium]
MGRSSGYFKDIGDAFTKVPDEHSLDLIYTSPSGPYVLYKGFLGERIVVFKCLKAGFRGDEVYESMLRHEFEIAHSLKHPGVCDFLAWVRLGDFGNAIVLEWIDGETLSATLRSDSIGEDTRKSLALQICDAVSYVHRKQVLHNDLKPDNIMVTRGGGVVKLIDFSLADSPSMVRGHVPAGTEGYAAPEVVSGGEASVASDIFSLGKIISSLLPSRTDVYGRCVKEEPSERFASVEEVRTAILSRRTPRWWIPALSALAAVMLAAAFLVPGVNGRRGEARAREVFGEAAALLREYGKPPVGADPSLYSFVDTLDCLNGRFVVTVDDGRMGIMDSEGRIIVDPMWEKIEFLSPQVARLQRNGLSYLGSAGGRIFAEGADAEELTSSFQERYERMLFEDMKRWDDVLDKADTLCSACLKGEDAGDLSVRLDALKRSLSVVSGEMTGAQRLRLEDILGRFEKGGDR